MCIDGADYVGNVPLKVGILEMILLILLLEILQQNLVERTGEEFLLFLKNMEVDWLVIHDIVEDELVLEELSFLLRGWVVDLGSEDDGSSPDVADEYRINEEVELVLLVQISGHVLVVAFYVEDYHLDSSEKHDEHVAGDEYEEAVHLSLSVLENDSAELRPGFEAHRADQVQGWVDFFVDLIAFMFLGWDHLVQLWHEKELPFKVLHVESVVVVQAVDFRGN